MIPSDLRQTVYRRRIVYMHVYKVPQRLLSLTILFTVLSTRTWPCKLYISQPKTCNHLPGRPPWRRACTRRAAASPLYIRNKAIKHTVSTCFDVVWSAFGMSTPLAWTVRSHSTLAQHLKLLDIGQLFLLWTLLRRIDVRAGVATLTSMFGTDCDEPIVE